MILPQFHIIDIPQKQPITHIEFGYKLLIIGKHLKGATIPREGQVVEDAIGGASIAVILDREDVGGEGADQVIEGYTLRGVVGEVHIGLLQGVGVFKGVC